MLPAARSITVPRLPVPRSWGAAHPAMTSVHATQAMQRPAVAKENSTRIGQSFHQHIDDPASFLFRHEWAPRRHGRAVAPLQDGELEAFGIFSVERLRRERK